MSTTTSTSNTSGTNATRSAFRLSRPWDGIDPFLFASRHVDDYPRGNAALGPDLDRSGRPVGADVDSPASWSMYHGSTVPGFPGHPHRGFETVTIVRKGAVDHADSTGASARYGAGDVQWVTAGAGIAHSEMFPLLDDERDNPFELYQIWLNLPAVSKGVDPEFAMLWREDVPVHVEQGPGGGTATVQVIAGSLGGHVAPAPPAGSWAADADHGVAIWLADLTPGAQLTLPGLPAGARRVLYVHGDGARVEVDGVEVEDGWGYLHADDGELVLTTGDRSATVLVLQGVPIGELVAARGPFVMNTEEEVSQAYADYRRTRFGGWPWPEDGPVHPRGAGRFARHGDGTLEQPGER